MNIVRNLEVQCLSVRCLPLGSCGRAVVGACSRRKHKETPGSVGTPGQPCVWLPLDGGAGAEGQDKESQVCLLCPALATSSLSLRCWGQRGSYGGLSATSAMGCFWDPGEDVPLLGVF